MSLLEDLRQLDLSAVISARGEVTASVSGGGMSVILDAGAVTSTLGDLGKQLADIADTLDDPAQLMAPLTAVFTELVNGLGGHELPVADLARAITDGLDVLTKLLGNLAEDPISVLGQALPDALETVTKAAGGYDLVGLEGLGRFGSLVARVEDGGPLPAETLTELALDVLAPFPRPALARLRASIDSVLTASAQVSLPDSRTQGLLIRLDAVTTAALAGDATAVGRALAELDRVRIQTAEVVRADLAAVTTAMDRLPIAGITTALATADNALVSAEVGVLELLEQWRADVASARAIVDGLDAAEVVAQLNALVDQLEAFLRAQFEQPITAAAGLVAEKVHEFFAHIPVRSIREAVSQALHAAVQTIQDADLDQPAEQVHAVLGKVRDAVAAADIGARVREALAKVTEALHDALDGVIAALGTVKTAIEAVAGPAAEILGKAVGAVRAFQSTVDTVTASLDELDLSAAVTEILARVRQIREAVEGVVSQVPLPEPVRPLIGQLVDQLEALNLGGELADIPILRPMLDTVSQLQLSETLHTVVHDGLTALSEAVTNLVPASLIDGIKQEIQQALAVVSDFNPAALLSGVTAQINGVADRIDEIDIEAVGAAAHKPFQQLMDGWNRLRPSTLLAPVSAAYQSALAGITVPSPESAISTVGGQVTTGGEQAGRTAAAPLAQLIPGAQPATEPATGAAPAPPGDDVADLRPGDVIRLFGYLPKKVREAVTALEAGPAGEVLTAIDHLIGALAADLRRVATALAGIEDRIDAGLDALTLPLGPAHARAQIALHASFNTGGLDLRVALDTVNLCGPGPLRAELAGHTGEARERVAGTHARHAPIAARLHTIADNLDRCPLARLTGDLDALLAALDPEPLAVEVDELVFAVIRKAPVLLDGIGAELATIVDRARALLGALNPAALGQRVLRAAIDALHEELAVFDPRLLAAELDEIHQAISNDLAAYDPAALAADLTGIQQEIVTVLRGLNPDALLGDLTELPALVAKAAQDVPDALATLADLPSQLKDLDQAFAGIDVDALLERVAALAPEVLGAFGQALDGIRTEIVALLNSLRYATGQIEVHAEVRT